MLFYDKAGQDPNDEAANDVYCERANWKSPVHRMLKSPSGDKIPEYRANSATQSNDHD